MPQSVSISSIPIVNSGRYRQANAGFSFEVDFSSSSVISEDDFCKLKNNYKKIKYEKSLPKKTDQLQYLK